MGRAPAIRKAVLDRLLKSMKEAGHGIERIEVRPDGIIITPLTAGASSVQRDELTAWREKRNGRRAAQGS